MVGMGFDCLDVATEALILVGPIVQRIERRDRALADQMKRAMDSVVSNISEGAGNIGKRRAEAYRYALGSALEMSSHLKVALAWGYLDDISAPLTLLERVRAMLWRLTH